MQFSGVEGAGRALEQPVRTRHPLGPESRLAPGAARCEVEPPPYPLAGWVLSQAGVDPMAYRATPLLRRLPACLRQLRVKCPDSAQRLLQRQPQLVPSVIDTLLIGVTAFFRDSAVFELLRNRVLPELLRTRGAIRVYSAGVSSGEELYSVAMLLAELGALHRCELLGIDCRTEAIARARRGIFPADALAAVDPALRARYFRREGSAWAAAECLRARMQWRVADVLTFAEPRPRDLILFRNVAIYLARPGAEVWKRLAAQLLVGGYLITGRAERPPANQPFQRIAPSTYLRTQRCRPLPPPFASPA